MAAEASAKRVRLSMACNECRRRKVKCDAEYPRCRNCAQRNHECFTSDSRRPHVPVTREWFEDRSSTVLASPTPAGRIQDVLNHSPVAVNNYSTNALPADEAAADEVSPLHLPYEMSFNADRNSNRIKMLGSSSAQCLTKSLDLYLERAHLKPVLPHFQHGLHHTEELDIPLLLSLPPLPAADARSLYMRHFFATVHMLWPICTVDETKASIDALATVHDFSKFSLDHIPMLALSYLIMSLGADEAAQSLTADGTKYLNAAASLLGHVILVPYLEAVQALMAYTIAYRGRNKDGLAWQMIGMATRIAQTLGLHRHSAINPSREHGVTEKVQQQFHARMWGICCCLEKTLQLEGGRPSAIAAVDDDQLMGDQRPLDRPNFLLWNIKLAEYQNGICQHIYGHRPGERRAEDILQNTSRLDASLLRWTDELPLQYRPENIMFCSDEHFTVAAFLCVQFHQAIITLHRAALIAPRGVFDAEVDKYCTDNLSRFRMKGGETIALNSARAIIRITLEVAERGVLSRIHSLAPIVLACIAMAIYLMKHPRGKTQGADLELLKSGLDHIDEQYTAAGQDRRVIHGITSIHGKLKAHLQSNSKTNDTNQVVDCLAPQVAPTARRQVGVHPSQIPALTAMYPAHRDAVPVTNLVEQPDIEDDTSVDKRQLPAQAREIHTPRVALAQTSTEWALTATRESQPPPYQTQYDNAQNTFDAINQDSYGIGPLPFDQYSMETMWDWMWSMDSTEPQFSTYS